MFQEKKSLSSMIKRNIYFVLVPIIVVFGVLNFLFYIRFHNMISKAIFSEKVAKANQQLLLMIKEADNLAMRNLDKILIFTDGARESIEKNKDLSFDVKVLEETILKIPKPAFWSDEVGYLVIDPKGVCVISTLNKAIVGFDFSEVKVQDTDYVSYVKRKISEAGFTYGKVFELGSKRLTFVVFRELFNDYILGCVFYYPSEFINKYLVEFLKNDNLVEKQGLYTSTKVKLLAQFEDLPKEPIKSFLKEDFIEKISVDFPEPGQSVYLWIRLNYFDPLIHTSLAFVLFLLFALIVVVNEKTIYNAVSKELQTVKDAIIDFKNNLRFSKDYKSEMVEITDIIETLNEASNIILADVQELEAMNSELENSYNRINELSNELKNAFYDFSQRLVNFVEGVENETAAHIKRTKEIVSAIVDELDVDEDLKEKIVNFSPLHDIGKIYVPKEILLKPGKLTPEEFEEVKKHTIYAQRLLSHPQFKVALNIAMYHHENYDGSGYPMGLKGEEIPIEAMVVKIVDIYDALRSVRPYKSALSHEEALKIILEGDDRVSPKHFDPRILDIFKRKADEIRKIYED